MKMKKTTTKKISLIFLGTFLILCLFFFTVGTPLMKEKFIWKNIVLADDNEEDEEENDHDKVIYEPKIETSSKQISTYVKEKTVTTTLFDSDGDGVFDDEDEYPETNNFFIVEDANMNGIVDKYEK